MSLLPATAVVLGALVLAQVPSIMEVAGVALVMVGVALHRSPNPASEVPEPAMKEVTA